MCGHFGICGPGILSADIDVFKALGIVSLLRGTDGSGILKAKVEEKKKPEFKIYKGPVNFVTMLKWYTSAKEGDANILKGTDNNIFAGHNRAATIGEHTMANTHPFKVGNTIGFHNGTLVMGKYRHEHKTDSELLIKDIDENGIQNTLEQLYAGNAYALVLFNKKTGRLTFTRNDERTLYFCFNKDREVMYWASEMWMLRSVLKRYNQEILDNDIYYFEAERIYTITPWDLRDWNNKEKENDCFESNVKFSKKYSFSVHHHTPYKPRTWESRNWDHWNTSNVPERVIEKGVIHKKRCAGCDKELSLVEQHLSKKLAYNTFICDSCDNFEQEQNGNDNKKDVASTEVHVG